VATDAPKSAHYRKRGTPGWAIGAATGRNHELLLAAAAPIFVPRGATLSLTLGQESAATNHFLGRFRIGVATDTRAADHVDTPPTVRSALATEPADLVDRDARRTRRFEGLFDLIEFERFDDGGDQLHEDVLLVGVDMRRDQLV